MKEKRRPIRLDGAPAFKRLSPALMLGAACEGPLRLDGAFPVAAREAVMPEGAEPAKVVSQHCNIPSCVARTS